MLKPEVLVDFLKDNHVTFYSGVPDSLLKDFCAYVDDEFPKDNHIIAANEGAAIGLGIGYHLSSGKTPLIYLQNSGLGNIINPLTSLCIPHGIFPHLVIGHRHTLPQHKVMGEVDEKMLDLIGYTNYTIVRGENNAN